MPVVLASVAGIVAEVRGWGPALDAKCFDL